MVTRERPTPVCGQVRVHLITIMACGRIKFHGPTPTSMVGLGLGALGSRPCDSPRGSRDEPGVVRPGWSAETRTRGPAVSSRFGPVQNGICSVPRTARITALRAPAKFYGRSRNATDGEPGADPERFFGRGVVTQPGIETAQIR